MQINKTTLTVFVVFSIGLLSTSYAGNAGVISSTESLDLSGNYTVRGKSLHPLLSSGDSVSIIRSNDTTDLKTDDIIACRFSGSVNPLIKIIKGQPGDHWELVKQEDIDAYEIKVNGQVLVTSEGKHYSIPEPRSKMIKLYAENYPVIPEDTYLVLGNRPEGTLDSTRFGLIHGRQIIGRVEALEKIENK